MKAMIIRRHTPLVLLAALIAAAFASLLLVPASGQTFDKTEGIAPAAAGSASACSADISDAQLAKNALNTNSYGARTSPANPPFSSLTSGIDQLADEHTTDDTAYLANPLVQTSVHLLRRNALGFQRP